MEKTSDDDAPLPAEPKLKRERKRKAKAHHEAGSLERFEVAKVHRSQLKNAPYNPRVMRDDERARLRDGIEKHGLVAPQTWNRRTGNLVGGHQRTSVLDDCYGTEDYELTVAVIDVDDVRERELNLLLNNGQAQGDWDMTKLEAMFKDTPSIDIKGTGFDAGELFRVFGASPFEARGDDAMSEVAQKIREARQRQAETRSKVKEREETEFYVVVVFKDEDDRDRFCDEVGWIRNRYQSGDQLRMIARDWIEEQRERQAALDAGAQESES